MYYEINVSKLEKAAYYTEEKAYKHLFATAPRSITDDRELIRVWNEFKIKFPAPEYKISIFLNKEEMEGVDIEEIIEEQKEG